MPVLFANKAAEIFFWIFFALTILSSAAHLALRGKWRLAPCSLIFLGGAAACYVPQEPLVYLPAFALAAGDFCIPLKKFGPYAGGALLAAAQILELVAIARLFPLSPALYIVAGVFLLLSGIASGLLWKNRREHFLAPILLCFPLLNVLFALKYVLFQPLYCGLFLLAGCLFFAAGEAIRLFKSKNSFYAHLPRILGEILLLFGLAMSLAI